MSLVIWGRVVSSSSSARILGSTARLESLTRKFGLKTRLESSARYNPNLRVWNYSNGQCVSQVQDDNKDAEYLCLSYNPFADVIAVGLDNGHIKLYDEKTLQVTSLLKKSLSLSKVDGHTDRVFAIVNHPMNPHEFVSSGWDNTLQVLKCLLLLFQHPAAAFSNSVFYV